MVPHTRLLQPGEIGLVDGLPCTSLARTVVDCCRMLDYRQALILMDHALRMGVDRTELWDVCHALAGRNGVLTLRRALKYADPRSESPGETLTREIIVRLRIERPDLQVKVRTNEGNHRIDLAWRAKRVALEFDGKIKYFDFAPTDEVLFRERQREKALIEQGWTFIRLTWRDLFREQELKAQVVRALRQAG